VQSLWVFLYFHWLQQEVKYLIEQMWNELGHIQGQDHLQ
jgi:hypothetical protein